MGRGYRDAWKEAKTAIGQANRSLRLDILLSLREHEIAKKRRGTSSADEPRIDAIVALLMNQPPAVGIE